MHEAKMRGLLGLLKSMEILEEKRAQFYQGILEKQKATLPGQFSVEDSVLVANVLGHKLRARPRVVRLPGGFVALEFLFRASHLGNSEVWRFYLCADGTLEEMASDPDVDARISDIGNDYAWKHLIERLLVAALDSTLFAPSPPAALQSSLQPRDR